MEIRLEGPDRKEKHTIGIYHIERKLSAMMNDIREIQEMLRVVSGDSADNRLPEILERIKEELLPRYNNKLNWEGSTYLRHAGEFFLEFHIDNGGTKPDELTFISTQLRKLEYMKEWAKKCKTEYHINIAPADLREKLLGELKK